MILESPVNPLTRALASAALGLLILERRLILKLFGARRVGYEFSKQLNLKRRAKKLRTLSVMRPPRLILAEESHGFALDCRHSNAGVQRRRLLGSRSLLVNPWAMSRGFSLLDIRRADHGLVRMSAIGTKQTSTSYLGEVAMRSIIQAKDRALKLNVLAVCAVFVFVGVVLLGAF